ncbi:CoB--CoM heterodisulfide reductase iron-sulfur subunit A family protein [Candidatus Bathyarchaeota archaeon]|nr:CoB--CoM heterodisulfide reductase iron-sulfur subunit A family protein [Candidatus Bathyarchaeota archaeon]
MNEKDKPRIGVFVCHCGVNIGSIVNVPEVVECAKTLPNVSYAEENLYTCSSEGLSKIKEAIKKHQLNRIVVASCTPRTHEPLFRSACEEAGLNKYLFHMANIREQCSWVHAKEPRKATEKAKETVRMAVAKAALLEPQAEPEIDVQGSAVVIGGGVSGMTAALSLANQQFKVYLIEKEKELGGKLKELYKLHPNDKPSSEILDEYVQSVRSNPNIKVYTSSTVKHIDGFIGNFEASINHEGKEQKLNAGTIIVATGADVFKPRGMYCYGENKNVITQLELEKLMKENKLGKPKNVVMIQCVGAREEKEGGRNYCSRICCAVAVKNALQIKELFPEAEVSILYRDMQTYGKEFEEQYQKARGNFVQFIRYDFENPPEVCTRPDGGLSVKVHDILVNATLELDADLVVLSTPLVQWEDAKELSKLLKVPLGADGFFFEAHVKLRPVDFATDGIFVCGTAHSPKTIAESIAQAYAAASRAGIPMALGRVRTEAITAFVDEDQCTSCGTCVKLCPYNAIRKDDQGIARVNDVLCKGCGVCAASCPEKAIDMRHFSDAQVLAEATAALGGS